MCKIFSTSWIHLPTKTDVSCFTRLDTMLSDVDCVLFMKSLRVSLYSEGQSWQPAGTFLNSHQPFSVTSSYNLSVSYSHNQLQPFSVNTSYNLSLSNPAATFLCHNQIKPSSVTTRYNLSLSIPATTFLCHNQLQPFLILTSCNLS